MVRRPLRPTHSACCAVERKEPEFAASVMAGFYGPQGNHIEARGANQMMGEAWAIRERLAAWLKWLLPIGLLGAAAFLWRAARLKAPDGIITDRPRGKEHR